MARDLVRFRRLVSVTIVATFGLIVIGGVVRVSGSGLGCGPAGSGAQGWPLCEGSLFPSFLESTTAIEFSHRVAATVVAVLILALVVQAFRRLRERVWLVRGSIAAGVLVLAQAGLGGLTVEQGLDEALVAAHLGLAMLLLALLVALRRLADPDPGDAPAADSGALRTMAVASTVLVLATIVAGGYLAGTEGEGTANEPVLGAHLACGEQFPTCVGKFMPFGTSRLIDIHLTHRLLMYLASVAVIGTAAIAVRQRARSRAFVLAVLLLIAQVLLGAINVWLGKHAGLIVAHLSLATLLWGTVLQAASSLLPLPEQAGRRVPGVETATGTASA